MTEWNNADYIRFEHNGVPCAVRKNQVGVWCGYAGVTKGHPYFQASYHGPREAPKAEDYADTPENMSLFKGEKMFQAFSRLYAANAQRDKEDDVLHYLPDDESPEAVLNCHGGVTFSGWLNQDTEKKVWYFGFDCGHASDYAPYMKTLGLVGPGVTYKTKGYAIRQAQRLADQLLLIGAGKKTS